VQTILTEERFFPGHIARSAVPTTADMILTQQVLHLNLDASGKIVACTVAEQIGPAPADPEACANYRERFQPKIGNDGGSKPFQGSVVMTLAVRSATQT
jgi:hypothetical protein